MCLCPTPRLEAELQDFFPGFPNGARLGKPTELLKKVSFECQQYRHYWHFIGYEWLRLETQATGRKKGAFGAKTLI